MLQIAQDRPKLSGSTPSAQGGDISVVRPGFEDGQSFQGCGWRNTGQRGVWGSLALCFLHQIKKRGQPSLCCPHPVLVWAEVGESRVGGSCKPEPRVQGQGQASGIWTLPACLEGRVRN
jgi:hypothetical protein